MAAKHPSWYKCYHCPECGTNKNPAKLFWVDGISAISGLHIKGYRCFDCAGKHDLSAGFSMRELQRMKPKE